MPAVPWMLDGSQTESGRVRVRDARRRVERLVLPHAEAVDTSAGVGELEISRREGGTGRSDPIDIEREELERVARRRRKKKPVEDRDEP